MTTMTWASNNTGTTYPGNPGPTLISVQSSHSLVVIELEAMKVHWSRSMAKSSGKLASISTTWRLCWLMQTSVASSSTRVPSHLCPLQWVSSQCRSKDLEQWAPLSLMKTVSSRVILPMESLSQRTIVWQTTTKKLLQSNKKDKSTARRHLRNLSTSTRVVMKTVSANAYLTWCLTWLNCGVLPMSRHVSWCNCLDKTRLSSTQTSCRCLIVSCRPTRVYRSRYGFWKPRRKAYTLSNSNRMLQLIWTSNKTRKQLKLVGMKTLASQ